MAAKPIKSLELHYTMIQFLIKRVKIRSSHGKLLSAVPQGSVLGPQLCRIFENDLFYNVAKAELSVYADDKRIFSICHKDGRNVQNTRNLELTTVSNWMDDNAVSIFSNAKKYESLLFTRTKN